ncbi:unnamed protein product, partial [Prorocentrum cordatum]
MAAPQIDIEVAKIGTISTADFAGLLGGLHQEGASVGGLCQQNLTAPGDNLKVMDIKQIVELAPLAKASDTHDAAQCKFQISLNPWSDVDLSVIRESLIQTGASHKPGPFASIFAEGIWFKQFKVQAPRACQNSIFIACPDKALRLATPWSAPVLACESRGAGLAGLGERSPLEPQAEFGRRLSTSGAQLLKLMAGDGVDNDRFGMSVAVSSDGARVVVGAVYYYYEDWEVIVHGSVYVLDGATGERLLKFVASDGAADDSFGESVAVSSDGARVVVGNKYDDDQGDKSGSVYVLDGATGERLLKLVASDGAADDWFGSSVAVSSDGARVVVGAVGEGSGSGSVYVLDGATGETLLKLVASDGAYFDFFGSSVAVSSDGARVVVGARGDDDQGSGSGSVYVLDGATGETLLKLVASDGANFDYFGSSVAVSSDGARVVVGACGDGDQGYNSGSVYVLDGATGERLLKLVASDGTADDLFGSSVAVSSDGARVVVGARGDDDQGSGSGSVYVLDGATGERLLKLVASDGAAYDFFGSSVAVSSDGARVVVGAYGDDDQGDSSGSAYVLDFTEVLAFMWLRTAMNYQYKNGGTLQEVLKKLWAQGGIRRLYQGLFPWAIFQAPLSRFGDVAANDMVLGVTGALLPSLPVSVATFFASMSGALFRI